MNHPWEVLYQAYQVRLQAHHLSLLFYNKLVMWLKGIHCILLDFDLIKHCKCQICLISIFIKFTEDLTRTCIIMLSSNCKCFMHYNLHLPVHKMQSFWMKFHVIFMPHLCKYNSFWTLCNTSPSLYIKELIGDTKNTWYIIPPQNSTRTCTKQQPKVTVVVFNNGITYTTKWVQAGSLQKVQATRHKQPGRHSDKMTPWKQNNK